MSQRSERCQLDARVGLQACSDADIRLSCAATALRIVLPDGAAMIEAAHRQPFSEAGDDYSHNGTALIEKTHMLNELDGRHSSSLVNYVFTREQ